VKTEKLVKGLENHQRKGWGGGGAGGGRRLCTGDCVRSPDESMATPLDPPLFWLDNIFNKSLRYKTLKLLRSYSASKGQERVEYDFPTDSFLFFHYLFLTVCLHSYDIVNAIVLKS
jgi:hypothetical protein